MPRPRLHLIRFHGVLAPNAELRALVVPAGPQEQEAGASQPDVTEPSCPHDRPARISWARLLERVLEIDLEHCPNCGGELEIIAAILEAPGCGDWLRPARVDLSDTPLIGCEAQGIARAAEPAFGPGSEPAGAQVAVGDHVTPTSSTTGRADPCHKAREHSVWESYAPHSHPH